MAGFSEPWLVAFSKSCGEEWARELVPASGSKGRRGAQSFVWVLALAYRVIGSLWGDRLFYIILEAKVEVLCISIQHAADNVSH